MGKDPDSDSLALLSRLNAVTLTAAELREFFDAVHDLPEEDRDFEGRAIVAAELQPGDLDKCAALNFRAEALARLLVEGDAPGWILRGANGLIVATESVFAAAGSEPLVKSGNLLVFEQQSFLRRVMELAKLDNQG